MKRDQYEVSLPHGGMAADYEAESIRGIFRGDGGGTDFDHYCAFWDSSQHHACDYRRDCGRGGGAQANGGALGRDAEDCVGLGADDSWSAADGGWAFSHYANVVAMRGLRSLEPTAPCFAAALR